MWEKTCSACIMKRRLYSPPESDSSSLMIPLLLRLCPDSLAPLIKQLEIYTLLLSALTVKFICKGSLTTIFLKEITSETLTATPFSIWTALWLLGTTMTHWLTLETPLCTIDSYRERLTARTSLLTITLIFLEKTSCLLHHLEWPVFT